VFLVSPECFTGVIAGGKEAVFRAAEGNDFGMCKPNGNPLKRTVEVGKLAQRMQELSQVYNSAKRKSDVAIYMSQQINHLMEGEKMTNNYLNSLIGANHMMTALHINSDFICEKEILKGSLDKYKVLILPCTYIISEECGAKVAEFVKNGGHVIADYILAEKRPGGLCYTELPGAQNISVSMALRPMQALRPKTKKTILLLSQRQCMIRMAGSK